MDFCGCTLSGICLVPPISRFDLLPKLEMFNHYFCTVLFHPSSGALITQTLGLLAFFHRLLRPYLFLVNLFSSLFFFHIGSIQQSIFNFHILSYVISIVFCKPIQGIFYFSCCLSRLVLYVSCVFADTSYLSIPSPEHREGTQGKGSDLTVEVVVLPTRQQRNPWFGQAALACWVTNRPPPPAQPLSAGGRPAGQQPWRGQAGGARGQAGGPGDRQSGGFHNGSHTGTGR